MCVCVCVSVHTMSMCRNACLNQGRVMLVILFVNQSYYLTITLKDLHRLVSTGALISRIRSKTTSGLPRQDQKQQQAAHLIALVHFLSLLSAPVLVK